MLVPKNTIAISRDPVLPFVHGHSDTTRNGREQADALDPVVLVIVLLPVMQLLFFTTLVTLPVR